MFLQHLKIHINITFCHVALFSPHLFYLVDPKGTILISLLRISHCTFFFLLIDKAGQKKQNKMMSHCKLTMDVLVRLGYEKQQKMTKKKEETSKNASCDANIQGFLLSYSLTFTFMSYEICTQFGPILRSLIFKKKKEGADLSADVQKCVFQSMQFKCHLIIN